MLAKRSILNVVILDRGRAAPVENHAPLSLGAGGIEVLRSHRTNPQPSSGIDALDVSCACGIGRRKLLATKLTASWSGVGVAARKTLRDLGVQTGLHTPKILSHSRLYEGSIASGCSQIQCLRTKPA